MSKVCQITGKRRLKGHKISHSNRKSKKTQEPNLKSKRYFIPSENRWVRLRLSTRAIRNIDKIGIETVWRQIQSES